jgi:Flp pilus assembly protein TadG
MRIPGNWSTGERRRGAAAAEMALLLPFLAFLFCVAVDYCRSFQAAQIIDSAARSAALYASGAAAVDPSTSAADAATQAAVTEGAALNPPLQSSGVAVSTGGGVATVTVTYSFELFTSYTGVADALTIQRTVTMPLAPQAGGP